MDDRDIDRRIADNDLLRSARDQKITAMRGELANLNKIAKALAAEKRAASGGGGGMNATAAGAVLTGSTKKR